MKKALLVLFLVSFLVSACSPGQISDPTFTPTPIDDATSLPTNTPTLTPTNTSIDLTDTPIAGLLSTPILPFGHSLVPEGALSRLGRGAILDVAISPDGKLLAVTTGIGLYLYRMDTLDEVWAQPTAAGPRIVAWSPNGRMLASALRHDVVIWDAKSGERLHTLQNWRGPITSIAWSPDSTTLVSVGSSSTGWPSSAYFWDVQTEEILPAPEFQGDYQSVAWSPDGKEVATSPGGYSEEFNMIIWDAQSRKRKRIYAEPMYAERLAWSPDGTRLAGASTDGGAVWDTATGKRLYTISDDIEPITLAWSPDGKQLVTAGGEHDKNGSLIKMNISDAATGRTVSTLQGHTFRVNGVAWSPQGDTIVSGSLDGTLRVWDAKTYQTRRTLSGYYRQMSRAAWSADSTLLAYTVGDGALAVWNTKTGELLRFLENSQAQRHGYPAMIAAWAPDRNTLAVDNNGIILWDAETGTTTQLVENLGSDLALAWSPAGTRIAVVRGFAATTSYGLEHIPPHSWIEIFDAKTGKQLLEIDVPGFALRNLAWSPDSAFLAARSSYYEEKDAVPGTHKEALFVWDAVAGKQLHELPYDQRSGQESDDVIWSTDGKILASSSAKEGVLLWDAATGKRLPISQNEGELDVDSVAWSPDGKRFASAWGGWLMGTQQITIWDAVKRNQLCTLKGHNSRIINLAWSPDGALLASTANDGTIILWDMTREACQLANAPATLTPPNTPTPAPVPRVNLPKGARSYSVQGEIYDFALSPDKEFLALATWGGLFLFRSDTFGQIWTKPATSETAFWTVKFSPDGKRLAAGGYVDRHGSVAVLDVATGETLSTYTLDYIYYLPDLAWSPDGTTLSVPYGGEVIVWDAATGQFLRLFGLNKRFISSMAWSPDGTKFAAGEGNLVTLWSTGSWEIQSTLVGHSGKVTSIAWSPDGAMLASGSSDNKVILWNAATSKVIYTLSGHTQRVTNIAWSPDGKTLASASDDNTIVLWNVLTSELIRTLKGHTSGVINLAWFPDGATLLSASVKGEVVFWPVDR